MPAKQILVADDHPEVLEEVRTALATLHASVATVESGQALVQAAQDLHPELVITDISMPDMSGFKAADKIRERGLNPKLIFLTVHSASAYVKKARELAADGYVLKIEDFENLPKAVAAVLAGGTYFSPQVEAAARIVSPPEYLSKKGEAQNGNRILSKVQTSTP